MDLLPHSRLQVKTAKSPKAVYYLMKFNVSPKKPGLFGKGDPNKDFWGGGGPRGVSGCPIYRVPQFLHSTGYRAYLGHRPYGGGNPHDASQGSKGFNERHAQYAPAGVAFGMFPADMGSHPSRPFLYEYMLLDARREFLDPGKKREKEIDRDYRVMVLSFSFLTMAFSVKFSHFPA